MAEKEPKGLLDIVANFKHLANPFHTLMYRGAAGHAPEGKFRLAKRDADNLALWNVLGTASWLAPTSMLAAYFANKWWDRKMTDAAHKSSVSRISAVRPTLTPDSDLNNISNIINDPRREVELVKSMVSKKAGGSDEDGALATWVKDVAASTVPLFAVPLTMLASKYAVDTLYSKRLKNRLAAERVAIRNHQNLVDHEVMKTQGLIKGASGKEHSFNPFRTLYDSDFRDRVEKFRARKAGRVGPGGMILSAPVLGLILGSGFLTSLAFSYLRKNDKDTGTLDYIRKKSLGHNVMQNTPELGLEQFGVPVEQIVARPGDKKQPGYVELPAADTAKPSIPALLDSLEELKPEASQGNVAEESKKKDALF